jgi:stringent starvation protein B
MTSTRPYLVRAIHEWIADNGFTPYLLVDCRIKGVVVPEGSIENNKIVLNISHSATLNLEIGNQAICFNARFNGNPTDIFVPLDSVSAIYAKENGRGLVFSEVENEEVLSDQPPDTTSAKNPARTKSPNLSVVK